MLTEKENRFLEKTEDAKIASAERIAPMIPDERWPGWVFNSKDVCSHYGYDEATDFIGVPPNAVGYWRNNETVLDELARLPEVLDRKQRVRIVFDYDPDYPRAMIQVCGLKGTPISWPPEETISPSAGTDTP